MVELLMSAILVVGIFIWVAIDNCRIELRYRNILLEKQNEYLKNNKL